MQVYDAACVVVKGFECFLSIAFAAMGMLNDNAYLGTTVSQLMRSAMPTVRGVG